MSQIGTIEHWKNQGTSFPEYSIIEPYTDSLQHLLAEVERIDALMQAQVTRLRFFQRTDEQLRGLYISEQEIDELLAKPLGQPAWAISKDIPSVDKWQREFDYLSKQIEIRKVETLEKGITLRLDCLARHFQLTEYDIDVILVCLTQELDIRYERLFAYLQDDMSKKRPSVDLVLNLLCSSHSIEEKIKARERFLTGGSLLKYQLISFHHEPSNQDTALLSRYLKLDERIANYLLGSDQPDNSISNFIRLIEPKTSLRELCLTLETQTFLNIWLNDQEKSKKKTIFYFEGIEGVGKQTTAEALVKKLGIKLLVIDGIALNNQVTNLEWSAVITKIVREATLQEASLYWKNFDEVCNEDKCRLRKILLNEIEGQQLPVFMAGSNPWVPGSEIATFHFIQLHFNRPNFSERKRIWSKTLDKSIQCQIIDSLEVIADKFRFTGEQIQDVAATARNLSYRRNLEHKQLNIDDIHAACRLKSNQKLGALAQKITPKYKWPDIVLPAEQIQQLQEICRFVKYRARVFGEWGFDKKLSLGKGLNILFAGPSGTGKTMAAEVIANELKLEIYKINLSTVVSKYIGETEKNLAHIFSEAETSNAILFFDEADALFGKRSEVKDAHDRYANIETSFLLQKMEEFEGIVILATNLRNNMDDAFIRRMSFAVQFPFPEEQYRRLIWQNIWPSETPIAESVDLDFMASQFKLAGGNIKNIGLSAAFLAIEKEQPICMEYLILATKREYQKLGKVCVKTEFGPYYTMIEERLPV